MLAVQYNYLGNSVGIIHNLPFSVPSNENWRGTKQEFDQFLPSVYNKCRYLLAITANKFQKIAIEILKKHNFKEIVTVFSSHNRPDETVSVWMKDCSEFVSNNIEQTVQIIDLNISNCTVGFQECHIPYRYVNIITVDLDNSTEVEKAKNRGFESVENTNVFMQVNKKLLDFFLWWNVTNRNIYMCHRAQYRRYYQ